MTGASELLQIITEEKNILEEKVQEEEGLALNSPRMRSSRGSLTDSAISSSAPSSLSSSAASSRSVSPEPLSPSSKCFSGPPASTTQSDDNQSPSRFAQLTYEQVLKLEAVLEEVVPVHGRGNFPTLEVKLKDLVRVVRTNLEKEAIHVRDIRLNGGAASHILSTDSTPYNDLDVIFSVDLSSPKAFDKVKGSVLDSLLDFMPEGVCKKRIGGCILKEAYVHKMVKVAPRDLNNNGVKNHLNGDRWSLISLSNNRGRNVELKFVDSMRRQFEFSVDSFQIVLDSLLAFYGCADQIPLPTENFYPTVIGESVYGDYAEALLHLEEKYIATRRPEEIRGGGLLKYCHLLVKGYVPARPKEIKNLERYMCSRFFIDFGDLGQQRNKLEAYLTNHFVGDARLRCEYLATLYRVVDESTICLMGHERRQTLCLIEEMACRIYFMEQQRLFAKRCQLNMDHPLEPNCALSPNAFACNAATTLIAGGRRFLVNGGFFYTPYMPTTGYCTNGNSSGARPAVSGANYVNHCSCGWVNCS